MEPFTLTWAVEAMGGQIVGETSDPNALVTSVCVDSRQAKPGALFFALQGENADGHAYVAQALKAGAVGAVVAHVVDTNDTGETTEAEAINTEIEPDGRPIEVEGAQIVVPAPLRALGDLARRYRRQFAIPIVGVTGSVGKTSTKEMIAQALRTTYKTLANEKNYNNEIGVPLTLFNLDKTHEAAVVEMGMRGLGQIDYLAEIAEPTIGVITNIGFSHLELLGSQENIAQAKSELLARLPANGVAVLPRDGSSTVDYTHIPTDDPNRFKVRVPMSNTQVYEFLASRVPEGCRIITTGKTYQNSNILTNVALYSLNDLPDGGVEGTAIVDEQDYEFTLRVVGRHHIANAEASLAVAHALDVSIPSALQALAEWQGAAGRMTKRLTPHNITVLDDCYNAGLESMTEALNTLQHIGTSNVAILGDMRELGDFAEQAHKNIGIAVASQSVKLLICIGPLAAIIAEKAEQLQKQAGSPTTIVRFADSASAAVHIRELVQPGDTVLVKGSRAMGMEVIVDALMEKTASISAIYELTGRPGGAANEDTHA